MGNEIEVVSNTAVQQTESQLAANDIIKLPEGKKIDTQSDEFFAVSVEVLPDNVKNEVKALAQSQNVKYSRFEICLFTLITVAIFAAAIYWLLPAAPELKEVSDDVRSKNSIITPVKVKLKESSPEAKLLKEMLDNYNAKRYRECLQLLPENVINEILADKNKLSLNAETLNCFLNSINLANIPAQEKQAYIKPAIRISRKLTELNPDSPAWHLHRLCFENYDIVERKSFENIVTIKGENYQNGIELGRLEDMVKYLENIRTKHWDKDLQRQFDLMASKIYIACWLNHLPYDDTHIRRETNSNGFREREAAWKIINKHSENSLEFLDLKKFILTTIKTMDTWYRGYEINGIKYYKAKHLDNMLQEIAEDRKSLNKAKQEKGL